MCYCSRGSSQFLHILNCIAQQWQSKKPPVMTRPSQASKPRSESDSEQSASTEIAREEPGTVNEEELPKSGE